MHSLNNTQLNTKNNNEMSFAICTVATTYLVKIGGFDPMMYGVIYSIVLHLVENIDYNIIYSLQITHYFTIWNMLIIVILSFLYLNWNIIGEKVKQLFGRFTKHNSINLYTLSSTRTLTVYISYFPDFYEPLTEIDIGDPSLILKNNISNTGFNDNYFTTMSIYKKSSVDVKNNFYDKNFNVKGYYVWKSKDIKTKTLGDPKNKDSIGSCEIDMSYPYITLYIEKSSPMSINEYYDKMAAKINEITFNDITLYSSKIFPEKNDESKTFDSMIYHGKKKTLEELEKLYIEPFFHPDKHKIWSLCKTIKLNPEFFYQLGQTPRIGMLLHGPPGTGKSSLVHKIAMTLQRHIVSIDLSSIKTKKEIYKLLRKPSINNFHHNPSDVVFVFDEFDIAIKQLYAKKKCNENIRKMWENHIFADIVDVNHFGPRNNDDNKTVIVSGIDKKDEKKDEKKDDKKDEKKDGKKKKSKYHYSSYLDDPDEISIEDLLELFQGPVPLDGAIIIATTNKFEEINNLCPALFRTGRLTPILFDNLTNDILSQMIKYYYKKDYQFDGDIYKYSLSPSTIVQIVMESKFSNQIDEYQYFMDHFNKKIKKIK